MFSLRTFYSHSSLWSVCCMTVHSNRCYWVCFAASHNSLPLFTLTCIFWAMMQSPAVLLLALFLSSCFQWDFTGISQVGAQRWSYFHTGKTKRKNCSLRQIIFWTFISNEKSIKEVKTVAWLPETAKPVGLLRISVVYYEAINANSLC